MLKSQLKPEAESYQTTTLFVEKIFDKEKMSNPSQFQSLYLESSKVAVTKKQNNAKKGMERKKVKSSKKQQKNCKKTTSLKLPRKNNSKINS